MMAPAAAAWAAHLGWINLALIWFSWVQLGESAPSLSGTGRIRCRSTPDRSRTYDCRPLAARIVMGALRGTCLASSPLSGASLGVGRQNGGLNPLYQIGGPRSVQLALKLLF
jgi:uncharacterized membrane protein